MAKRLFLIVMDGMGVGASPDAVKFADQDSNTLRSLVNTGQLHTPTLHSLGLFNIEGVDCGERCAEPTGAFARMAVQAPGNDSMLWYWELAGVHTEEPHRTYPEAFPEYLLNQLYGQTYHQFICNQCIPSKDALLQFGREHIRSQKLIIFSSEASVMQIAAHETMVKPRDLYEVCEKARVLTMWDNKVGRIIARPFTGDPPDGYAFLHDKRKDYAMLPEGGPTMLDALHKRWMEVISLGKVADIFTGRGVTRSLCTRNVMDGMEQLLELSDESFSGMCFAHLSGFDSYGHEQDAQAFAELVSEFDVKLGEFINHLGPEDIMILTATHGCDPEARGRHTREYVPMLMFGDSVQGGVDLGTRTTYADVAATVQEYFELDIVTKGTSFLEEAQGRDEMVSVEAEAQPEPQLESPQ